MLCVWFRKVCFPRMRNRMCTLSLIGSTEKGIMRLMDMQELSRLPIISVLMDSETDMETDVACPLTGRFSIITDFV